MKFACNLVVAFSLAVLSIPAWAESDISGSYKCTGYDSEAKSSYDADLMIVKTGDSYSFKWKESDSEFSGTGIFSKAATDIVAAEFWNPSNQNKSGVIIYQVKTDTLNGNWAYADKGTVGTETCKKQK